MEATFTNHRLEIRGLPRRQAQALGLTFSGMNSKQAAKEMGISPRTVEMNVNNAMAKLGVANRVELAIEAAAQGVLVIKSKTRAVTFSLVCALSIALLPGAGEIEDLNRLPLRTLRVRRRNEDLLTVTHLTEEDDA